MPCLPNSQSIGPAHSSKSANSVREHESLGRRSAGIGENRVSSNADVRAYVSRPFSSGNGSNVPMHPRNDLCPDLESVFHVTNIGYDSVTDSREAYVGGAISSTDVVLVSWVMDEFTDALEGVETVDCEEGVALSSNLEMGGSCNCPVPGLPCGG